jgi:hypothetical protein
VKNAASFLLSAEVSELLVPRAQFRTDHREVRAAFSLWPEKDIEDGRRRRTGTYLCGLILRKRRPV